MYFKKVLIVFLRKLRQGLMDQLDLKPKPESTSSKDPLMNLLTICIIRNQIFVRLLPLLTVRMPVFRKTIIFKFFVSPTAFGKEDIVYN